LIGKSIGVYTQQTKGDPSIRRPRVSTTTEKNYGQKKGNLVAQQTGFFPGQGVKKGRAKDE